MEDERHAWAGEVLEGAGISSETIVRFFGQQMKAEFMLQTMLHVLAAHGFTCAQVAVRAYWRK